MNDIDNLSVEDVAKAINAGDRICRYHVKKAAEHIGMAIANAVTILNPRMIVLYGFMLDLGDFFIENLERAIRENSVFFASGFEMRISTVSESILPLGAAANIFYGYLRCDDYKWVYRMSPENAAFINEAPFMY